mmetsp:Transcript_28607/g.62416  ORF Transcript_28607/g.62416 Transcript_28607/m.62416 type:complete len:221 (+) Transcript_28607:777-1439(+)
MVSLAPLKTCMPFQSTMMAFTGPECPSRTLTQVKISRSHCRILPSSEALTAQLLFLLSRCPLPKSGCRSSAGGSSVGVTGAGGSCFGVTAADAGAAAGTSGATAAGGSGVVAAAGATGSGTGAAAAAVGAAAGTAAGAWAFVSSSASPLLASSFLRFFSFFSFFFFFFTLAAAPSRPEEAPAAAPSACSPSCPNRDSAASRTASSFSAKPPPCATTERML